MANIKSSKKAIRKIAKLTARNKSERSRLKTLSKRVQKAKTSEDKLATKLSAIEYMSALDKAVKHNVIHHNKASRLKARLSQYIFVDLPAAETAKKVPASAE